MIKRDYMGSSGWKHLKQLQDATRDGYNNLSTKTQQPDNSLAQELMVDLFLIAVGLSIYIQLDVGPFLPFSLPDVIQNGSYRPFVAMIGLAIAAMGGLRMLFALFEAATWLIAKLFPKKKSDD
jgi:hypothetical protein